MTKAVHIKNKFKCYIKMYRKFVICKGEKTKIYITSPPPPRVISK